MDHTTSSLDFAAIGHQENWDKVTTLVNSMRQSEGRQPLSQETIQEIFPFIPPRPVFDITFRKKNGASVNGIYIETFINPDHLDIKHMQQNLMKVKEACACAANAGVRIASLGGFASIVLEAGNHSLQMMKNTFFTTGNTLTAAFICKGLEKACVENSIDLSKSTLLVIGATGDIGSACVQHFSGVAKKLLLCARNARQLHLLSARLLGKKVHCSASVDINTLLPEADVIILVASSSVSEWNTELIKDQVIICDAGYPKNISRQLPAHLNKRVFCGGMGFVAPGFFFTPRYMESFYSYPKQNVSHGCMLESIVLSMENKPEAYSVGRGNITSEKMKAILHMANENGIDVAPFFNATELWHNEESNPAVNYA